MCFMCDSDSKAAFAQSYWDQLLGQTGIHFQAAAAYAKLSSGLAVDGVGDIKPSIFNTGLIVTPDEDGGNDSISSARDVTVNGDHIVATINTIGDQDFFKVTLEAGKTYEIGQYAKIGGPNAVPLADAYIEIYDSTGKLVVTADGGGPNTPSGLDALLSFTPDASGVYYINARSYDQDPVNGTTGDFVGDYELFVDLAAPGTYVYKPYYDVDSPLYALDWGSQVDRTSRNPDGAEGPRVTGNDFTGVGWNPYGIEGKNVITVYFAKAGEIYVTEDPANAGLETMVASGFRDWEKAAFYAALETFQNVADVVFVEVQNRNEADFKFITYDGTPQVGVLGRMSPPNEQNEGQAEFNRNGPGWNETALVPGGFSFVTLVHEIGHGMGLSHPHDNGGRSGIMRGVVAEGAAFDYTTGDFNLNQGVFTMMSYEDGWQTSPHTPKNAPTTANYGYLSGLMAFDIAVIQDKYGVNEEYRTGNDTYTIRDTNAQGTFYQAIWDAGGTDEIVYDGARDSVIDLRAATLKYEEGGGGRISYALNVFGGYTIADGVTIENARSGGGNDSVIGNEANNILIAGAGNDSVSGHGGDDALYGGAGKDMLTGGAGKDSFLYALLTESAAGADRDLITDFEKGSDKIDLASIGATLSWIGTAGFGGQAGQVRYSASGGNTVVQIDGNGDGAANFEIELSGIVALAASDFVGVGAAAPVLNAINGTTGHDVLRGTAGGDHIRGLAGSDRLEGLAGDDILDGGDGNDSASYTASTAGVTVSLAVAGSQDTGGAGIDTLIGIENLMGGSGADRLTGDGGNNVLTGNGGNDVLDGGGGGDVITGGAGADVLRGGAGGDRFVYNSVSESTAAMRDLIEDFTAADRIDLRAIDAVAGTATNDAFSFVGSAAFSGKAGELRYAHQDGLTLIAADVNGDSIADLQIALTGTYTPTVIDFVL